MALVRTWYNAARWHGTSFSFLATFEAMGTFHVLGEFPGTLIQIFGYILLDMNFPGTLIFVLYTCMLYILANVIYVHV